MEIIRDLREKVKVDADGYDNIDQFWDAMEVLRFPLSKPISKYLNKCSDEYMDALTGSKYGSQETDPGNSTDEEFNYDDNESFSDGSDDESIVSVEVSPIKDVSIALTPHTKGDKSTRSSIASTKNTLSESIPLEDTLNTTFSSERSSRRSLATNASKAYNADESRNESIISNLNTTVGSVAPSKAPSKASSGKTRKSSGVGLNDSGVSLLPASSVDSGSPHSTSMMTLDTHNTSVPGSDFKETSRASSGNSSKSRNTTRTSVNNSNTITESTVNESSVALTTPNTKGNRTRSITNTLDSNFSLALSGVKTPGDRRVTFGSMPALSPIDNETPHIGSTNKKNTSKRLSVGSINDPSTDISRLSQTQTSPLADDQQQPNDDYGNDNDDDDGGDDGYYNNNDPDDYEDNEPQNSSIRTPQSSNKSANSSSRHSAGSTGSAASKSRTTDRSGYSSAKSTPRSGYNTSKSSVQNTPESFHMSELDTPNTGKFYKGFQLPDESFKQDSEDDEIDTDREEDPSTLLSPSANASFALDESSLMNETFLYTISEKNPEYVLNKDPAFIKKKNGINNNNNNNNNNNSSSSSSAAAVSKKRKALLHTSDEEENYDDLGVNSDSEEDKNVRRSSRATKGKKFAFWKNERPLYDHGTMVGVSEAAKTPKKAKPTKTFTKQKQRPSKSKSSKSNTMLDDVDAELMDTDEETEVKQEVPKQEAPKQPRKVKLPKDVKFMKRSEVDNIQIWNEIEENVITTPVIARCEDVESKLKELEPKTKDNVVCFGASLMTCEQVVGSALPTWLTGQIVLPAQAIKKPEGVGRFVLIGVVLDCQPEALELAYAHPEEVNWTEEIAQRFLLKKNDCFQIPPGNIYRLQNHSESEEATIHWTIIKPIIEWNLVPEESTESVEVN